MSFLNVIFLILGVISGIPATIFLYDKIVWLFLKKNTWKKVVKGVQLIMKKLWRDEYNPDVIIGAGRAGSIITGIISGNLKNYKIPIYCFDFSYEWKNKIRKTNLNLNSLSISGKKVLVIVGEVQTGDTLKNIVEQLELENPKIIKTVSLFRSGVEVFKPNYYAYTSIGKQKMPWHLNEKYEKNNFPSNEM